MGSGIVSTRGRGPGPVAADRPPPCGVPGATPRSSILPDPRPQFNGGFWPPPAQLTCLFWGFRLSRDVIGVLAGDPAVFADEAMSLIASLGERDS